jgi:DNA ligase (NAD+)
VGQGVAQIIVDNFSSIDALQNATEEELQSTEGIGPTIAASIVHFFGEKHNKAIVKELVKAGLTFTVAPRARGGALSGTIFVLTGTLPSYGREEAKQLIEAHGGRVASGISKTVTHVLAGDDAGSKLQKARSLGIPVISEAEFNKLIGA